MRTQEFTGTPTLIDIDSGWEARIIAMEISFAAGGLIRVSYARTGASVLYAATVSLICTAAETTIVEAGIGLTPTDPQKLSVIDPVTGVVSFANYGFMQMQLPDIWWEGTMEVLTEVLPSATNPDYCAGRYELRRIVDR